MEPLASMRHYLHRSGQWPVSKVRAGVFFTSLIVSLAAVHVHAVASAGIGRGGYSRNQSRQLPLADPSGGATILLVQKKPDKAGQKKVRKKPGKEAGKGAKNELKRTPAENCASKNPKARIDGCSKIIEAGKLPKKKLATVYTARGYAYLVTRKYNLAILDFDKSLKLKPGDASVHIYRGHAFGSIRDYKRAIADFNRAIKIEPKNAAVYADRGSAYNAVGDTKRALSDYAKVIKHLPEAAFAYTGRAAVYKGLGKDELALADYDKAVMLAPKYWPNVRERGSFLLSLGYYKRAIRDFSAAIRLYRRDFNSYRDRAIARSMLGNYGQAIKDLNSSIKIAPYNEEIYRTRAFVQMQIQNFEAARANLDKAISLKKNNVDALVARARLLALTGDIRGAQADVEKAITLAPDRGDVYLARALIRAKRGKEDKALEDVQTGFGLNPDSTSLAIAGASILTQIGEPLSALAVLAPILTESPKNVSALLARAEAYAAQGDTEAALSDSATALVLRPMAQTYLVRANVYLKAGKPYLAVRELEGLLQLNAKHSGVKAQLETVIADSTAALEKNAGDVEARLARSFARLALEQRKKPQVEEVFEDLKTVIEARPADPRGHLGMGKLRQLAGRTDLAKADYEKAVKLDPGLAEAFLKLGMIKANSARSYWLGFIPLAEAARLDPMLRARVLRWVERMRFPAIMTVRMQPKNVDLILGVGVANSLLGDFDKAMASLNKAAELSPDNAEVYFQRALARKRNGQIKPAIADMERALKLASGDKRIERTLKALQNEGD